ncbi:aminotransferase class V-fold PLP-dependent enzyme [Sphaerisporangium rubeum]|uniref:Selenocysteine lyase/cysteine desulfurase n=1 Tax=Sphaerisporangium rubeum TaxID=321317 RepID=A0A7X0IFQ1_9ACTN|nr:aminotransferase class V-fold PLP-dependent enzyme [Sphaerisporangium rubeum]MBB6474190.1 selenocysteine lyase/cysteine desulfurase [Sphaerisporangium rubeum]
MGLDITEAQKLWDPMPGWLDSASYGLPPRPAFEALQSALADWRVGRTSWRPWNDSTARARAAFAAMMGVAAQDVAVGATVSQMLAPVASSLPPGSRVVAPEEEFTSNLFPWAVSADLRTVPMDRLADAVDAGTRVVAFSLVQSADGRVAPIDDILAAARTHDALVCVDASQACGWLPVDASRFDVLVCGAYKWLMAPRGASYGYLSPRARAVSRPTAANWFAADDPFAAFYGPPLRLAEDARAFDLSPAWFCQVGAAPALELLNEIGVEAVHTYNTALAARFLTALDREPTGSAIVTVDVPGAEERLNAAGIRTSVRAGKVRASFHLYSTEDDVDQAVKALTG